MLKHDYADVNGIRLHYVSKGQGKLILFLHGFPEFWYAWRRQLDEFGKDYLAVALDMRGYNLSSKPPEIEQYRMRVLTEDIRQFVEYLGQKKLILVAHDWGASVAWAFAISNPDCLERLIIINGAHPATFYRELSNNAEQRKASQYILFYRSPDAEKKIAENNYAYLLNRMYTRLVDEGYMTHDDLKSYIKAWSQPNALTGGLNYYRATRVDALEGKPMPPLDDSRLIVKVPTLVIWGDKDIYLLTGLLDGLGKYVPQLTVEHIPDASHWVIHEKPETVNRYILDFIKGKRQDQSTSQ